MIESPTARSRSSATFPGTIAPSSLVDLNRAVAVWKVRGAEAGQGRRQLHEALERRVGHAGTGSQPRPSEATGCEVNVWAATGGSSPISVSAWPGAQAPT